MQIWALPSQGVMFSRKETLIKCLKDGKRFTGEKPGALLLVHTQGAQRVEGVGERDNSLEEGSVRGKDTESPKQRKQG